MCAIPAFLIRVLYRVPLRGARLRMPLKLLPELAEAITGKKSPPEKAAEEVMSTPRLLHNSPIGGAASQTDAASTTSNCRGATPGATPAIPPAEGPQPLDDSSVSLIVPALTRGGTWDRQICSARFRSICLFCMLAPRIASSTPCNCSSSPSNTVPESFPVFQD